MGRIDILQIMFYVLHIKPPLKCLSMGTSMDTSLEKCMTLALSDIGSEKGESNHSLRILVMKFMQCRD